MSALLLIEVPESKDLLLFLRLLNPVYSQAIVYGVLPEDSGRDTDRLFLTLETLFSRNGSSEYPLLGDLPTHVPPAPGSPLAPEQVKELFFLLAMKASNIGYIEAVSENLARYKGDPWARASAEFKEGMKAFDPGAKTGELRPGTKAVKPTRSHLERWWALVTDPQHVESETSQMQKAWEGSLRFLKGGAGGPKGRE